MSLTIERKKELVESLVLAPGWYVTFIDQGPGKLEIYTDNMPDAASIKDEVSLYRREYMPPGADKNEGSFLRWVLYEYLWLHVHEGIEWFRYKDTGKAVFDAHDAETTATRLLPPRPGEIWFLPTTDELRERIAAAVGPTTADDVMEVLRGTW
jgi:hypothetical protein